jgi:putative heme-binding domain-containing protein
MPFGNYGYKDQITGAGWRVSRTNMHAEIPKRHWHQNDPGVIPNMLETGAGSPTGICVYEGDQLSSVFKNQIIHCDAGPSVVRSYPVKSDGAGYAADMVNVMDGSELNQWFRPSDVCVAPDGSLIVADWYDPGVGGHRMQDVERGRLFRVSSKTGVHPKPATPDFSNPASAVAALKSPNLATRFLAWNAIETFGSSAMPQLKQLWESSNPRIRARALWRIGKLAIPKQEKLNFIIAGLNDHDPELRCCAIRLCVQILSDVVGEINLNDPSPAVIREILLAMRQWRTENSPEAWAILANNLTQGDRWLLEAIGIAADGHWDECLDAWLVLNPAAAEGAAGKDIVWRSRATKTAELLKDIVAAKETGAAEIARYFRAFDLLPAESKQAMTVALRELAFDDFGFESNKAEAVMMEAVSRIEIDILQPEEKKRLDKMVDLSRGTPRFLELVDKFSSAEHYPDLFEIATTTTDRQLAADAMRVMMDKAQMGFVHGAFIKAAPDMQVKIADALINCGNRKGEHVLAGVAKRRDIDEATRVYAIERLGGVESGCRDMIWWIDQKKDIDPLLMPYIKAALHKSSSEDVRQRAQELFPIANSKDSQPLPSIADLAKLEGNIQNGARVFQNNGTCAKCHRVAGQGIEVGPDLTEIGDKLTRLAMYESILFPSAGISHNYENWKVVTDDGKMFTGVLVSESDTEIELKDKEGIRQVIPVDQIDEKAKQKLSLMPDNLHQSMSSQELVDLVEYLVSLKK